MIFEWFTKKDQATSNVVPFPKPELAPDPEPKEYYRVGSTVDGNTTLTLMSLGGMSLTMTMNRDSCEQLIRMLRATYTDEE
jgi:hypothetical protein